MVVAQQADSTAALKLFLPLNRFNRFQLAEMAAQIHYEDVSPGRLIFKPGDTGKDAIYLHSGEVVIAPSGRPVSIIAAGDRAARYPLACAEVCTVAAYAKTHVRLLKVPRTDLLLYAGARVQQSYEVATLEALGHGQWVSQWLDSPLLARLPSAEVEAVVERMTEMPVSVGETVLQQDDSADSYYVIKKGRCAVLRRPAAHARAIQLAVLGEGQGFGEEALITDAKRNATVRMLEDGILMRLSKADFIEHLTKPLLRYVDWPGVEGLQQQGAVLIDVRSPEEFETSGLVGSLNIPMPLLRLKAGRLNRNGRYVLLSGAGQTGAAAAFLLMQQGLEVWVLKDGLDAVPLHRRRGGDAPKVPAQAQGPVVSFCIPSRHAEETGTAPAHPLEWVSDHVLWQTTLGYRHDPKVEALVAPLATTPVAECGTPVPPPSSRSPRKKDFTVVERGSKLNIDAPAKRATRYWTVGLVLMSAAAGYGLGQSSWGAWLSEVIAVFAEPAADRQVLFELDVGTESGRIVR